MEYIESPEQAAEYATTALVMMQRYRVVANPHNFTCWYAYVSARIPDLNKAIDIIISNNKEFSEEICNDLYARFFTNKKLEDTLTTANTRIEAALSAAVGYLKDAAQDTNHYTGALGNFSAQLTPHNDMQAIRSAVAEIVDHTKQLSQKNKELIGRLNNSQAEINQLKTDIEDVKREAMTDALTGIANRKLFDLYLREAIKESMETGNPLSLIMADIDHFKRFNDTYGHQIGDQVLKLVAKTLVDNIKGQDKASRYGGEEFIIILPKTDRKGAFKVAENIRGILANKTVLNRRTGESLGHVTISAGISEFSFGEPLTQFIHRADEALYSAKRNGRNRVCSDLDSGLNLTLAEGEL